MVKLLCSVGSTLASGCVAAATQRPFHIWFSCQDALQSSCGQPCMRWAQVCYHERLHAYCFSQTWWFSIPPLPPCLERHQYPCLWPRTLHACGSSCQARQSSCLSARKRKQFAFAFPPYQSFGSCWQSHVPFQSWSQLGSFASDERA